MKHFILSLCIFAGFATQAQPAGDRQQKVEALYIAYITRELKLTEDEAQKFWPVHGQFDDEIRGLKVDASELNRQQAVLNIKKKYQDRFTKILGAQRTNDFFIKDGEFRKKLVERLRKMRQQNQAGGRSLRQ
ncbi:MAG: hypothetical protein EOO03_11420 [Chitinophagaceae bacterium]|nr:MAG: hypothetical protein EOO03_11420 [Chitinophagaceae bacterium]